MFLLAIWLSNSVCTLPSKHSSRAVVYMWLPFKLATSRDRIAEFKGMSLLARFKM